MPDSLYPHFTAKGCLLQNEASRVIEVDVTRTGCTEALLEPLRRVLLAFAVKNPQIGYCQSMNYIVATLLQCCNEESAFWVFCAIVEDVLPRNYFSGQLVGVRLDTIVLNSLIMRYPPAPARPPR